MKNRKKATPGGEGHKLINFNAPVNLKKKFNHVVAQEHTNMTASVVAFMVQKVKEYEAENGPIQL